MSGAQMHLGRIISSHGHPLQPLSCCKSMYSLIIHTTKDTNRKHHFLLSTVWLSLSWDPQHFCRIPFSRWGEGEVMQRCHLFVLKKPFLRGTDAMTCLAIVCSSAHFFSRHLSGVSVCLCTLHYVWLKRWNTRTILRFQASRAQAVTFLFNKMWFGGLPLQNRPKWSWLGHDHDIHIYEFGSEFPKVHDSELPTVIRCACYSQLFYSSSKYQQKWPT